MNANFRVEMLFLLLRGFPHEIHINILKKV